MKAVIRLDIDDRWLRDRVADFNAEMLATEGYGKDEEPLTPRQYATNVLQDAVLDDALRAALWTWEFDATLEILA